MALPYIPLTSIFLQAGVILNQLHVVGGVTVDSAGTVSTLKCIQRFDEETGTWIELADSDDLWVDYSIPVNPLLVSNGSNSGLIGTV